MKYLHYSKRYFYFFLLLILSLSTKGLIAQKGLVNKGAKMSIGENARIIISGSDLQFVNESASGEDGSIDLDGYLILEGPFYNNATAGECFVNLNNIGSVFFIGNTEQIIGGTGNIRFENIRINNTANILLNRNVSVEKEINFIDGDLFLNGYTLYLEDDGSITGSLGSSMIIANSGGYLYKKFNAPGSFVFPIGDNTGTTEYTPVDFTLSSYASITNAYFGLSVSDQKYAENTSPSEFLTRYWDLQHTGITDPVYSVDFHYLTNDINGTEADIFAARYYSTLREVFTRVDDFSNILYVNDIGSMGAYTGVDG